MKRRIIIAPDADRDIDEHVDYIARDSMDAAVRFFAAVERAIDDVAHMPNVGHTWAFKSRTLSDIRVWRVHKFTNHLIFYRVIDEGIEIVRVLHAARDIDAVFDQA